MIIVGVVKTARRKKCNECLMPNHSIVEKIQKFLAKKKLPAILALIAVVISLPTVLSGFEPLDDLRHRSKLLDPARLPPQIIDTGMIPENSGKLTTVLHELHSNVYTKEKVQKQKDYGVLPWWTHEDYKASNWRPLDSFTHWLDYRFYPNTPALIHLHNLLWFGVVILLITILYRKFLAPAWLAGLAAILYLLDDSNCIPAAWIANRNLLIALAFTVLTILAHHKWRRDNSALAGFLALVCLLCSLLATEAGIAAFVYLFAYVVAIDRARWFKRALSLLPALIVIVLWRLLYNHLGHGAFTSGFICLGAAYQSPCLALRTVDAFPCGHVWLSVPPRANLRMGHRCAVSCSIDNRFHTSVNKRPCCKVLGNSNAWLFCADLCLRADEPQPSFCRHRRVRPDGAVL
jgi:hypothetical protein